MKKINILVVYRNSFTTDSSFYYFYSQLSDYLNQNGINSKLHFVWLQSDTEHLPLGIQLPSQISFNEPDNIEAAIKYIQTNSIDIIFNFNTPIRDLFLFLKIVKERISNIKILELIHSCPDHSISLKKFQLLDDQMEFTSKNLKETIIKLLPNIYLRLLKCKVKLDYLKSLKLYDGIVLLTRDYALEYISIVGNGYSDKVFFASNPHALNKSYKQSVPIEKKEKKIIFVGRFSKEKNIPTLLSIWSKVEEQLPDWQFEMVGGGPEYQKCIAIAKKFDLKNICFHGEKQAIPFIDSARIICLTSAIEGLPTVFMEAMTLGVVPIGFDSFSGIREMIDNWENGVVLPKYNTVAYVDAVVKIAQDDELRQKMANNAQIKVQKFDMRNIGRQWMHIFTALCLVKNNKT